MNEYLLLLLQAIQKKISIVLLIYYRYTHSDTLVYYQNEFLYTQQYTIYILLIRQVLKIQKF